MLAVLDAFDSSCRFFAISILEFSQKIDTQFSTITNEAKNKSNNAKPLPLFAK